jgi:hypothetical protein
MVLRRAEKTPLAFNVMNLKRLFVVAATAAGLTFSHAADKKSAAAAPELKIHPKVFTYIEGWLSDGESPIATELNLDAVETSTNQFQPEEVQQEDGWIRAKGRDGQGFIRYRVTEHKGSHYKVDYQENGGGTLTTMAKIEFTVEKRDVRVDGKTKTIRVLRVLSYADKP